jgi:SAM-dependent methyltransferase
VSWRLSPEKEHNGLPRPEISSMAAHSAIPDENYDALYRQFDTPVMHQVRQEAYGEDIGQHSWVLAEDLRRDVTRLRLSGASTLLDLGCGPCGPLVFVVASVGCRGTGVELSAAALDAGRARVAAHGLCKVIELHRFDLNESLPLPSASCTAAMSFDVILHLADREAAFRAVARVLIPGGRFLFTDAAVVTGSISSEQVHARSVHGLIQFAAEGFNERCLEQGGFRLLETEDRTTSVMRSATGRLAARLAHREQLEQIEGRDHFEREQRYLETVLRLAETRSLSRVMYLAEVA